MQRTCLTAAVLASALCLGAFPAAARADGLYIYINGGGTDLGYRLSGQNRYNLNVRPAYGDHRDGHRGSYQRSGFLRFYGYPYPRYRQYRDRAYGHEYRRGYRDGYRDGLRNRDGRRHHGLD